MDSPTFVILSDGWGISHSNASITAEAVARVLAKRCKVFFAIPDFYLETLEKAKVFNITLLKPKPIPGMLNSVNHLPLVELENLGITHVIGISDLTSGLLSYSSYKPYKRIIIDPHSDIPAHTASHAQYADMIISLGNRSMDDLDRELEDRLQDIHYMFDPSILRGDFRLRSPLKPSNRYNLSVLYEDELQRDVIDFVKGFHNASNSLREQGIELSLNLIGAKRGTADSLMKQIKRLSSIRDVDLTGNHIESIINQIHRTSMFCVLPGQVLNPLSAIILHSGIPVLSPENGYVSPAIREYFGSEHHVIYDPDDRALIVTILTSIFGSDGSYHDLLTHVLSLRDKYDSDGHIEVDRLVHLLQTGEDLRKAEITPEYHTPLIQTSNNAMEISNDAPATSNNTAGSSSASSASSGDKECSVCMEPLTQITAIVPCFHARCCKKCILNLPEPKCPECRVPIEGTKQIYL